MISLPRPQKTYIMYTEGTESNKTKRDALVKAMPAMQLKHGYDSVIIANTYNGYYNTLADFKDYYSPILAAAKVNGMAVIPSVHTYLSPVLGNDIYSKPEYLPLGYANEKTWEYYFERVKLFKSYESQYPSLAMRYVYFDMEDTFWAQMDSPVYTSMTIMQIAGYIAHLCRRCGDIGVTPIFYNIYPRPEDTGVPGFSRMMRVFVASLCGENIVFGDPSTYANPLRAPVGWFRPLQDYVKAYPEGARSKVFFMGIELSNATYGYTDDEWDAYVKDNQIPWSGLFGVRPPV